MKAIAAADGYAGTYGGIVYLPNGTYDIDSPIDLLNAVTLRGQSATGTIINYTGPSDEPAIAFTGVWDTDHYNLSNVGVQNLTIISDGAGIGLADPAVGAGALDVENVAFSTHGIAIDLPSDGGAYHEGAQDAYFHNIQIDVSGLQTGDADNAGAGAIVLNGSANTIDGLLINGSPDSDFTNPTIGWLIWITGYGNLVRNVTIDPYFDDVPGGVTDFYLDTGWITMQDIYAAPATDVQSTRYIITSDDPNLGTDVSIDSLSLNSDNRMEIDGSDSPLEPSPVVVIDNLIMPSGATLADSIQSTGLSAVHVSQVNGSASSVASVTLDDPALPTQGYDVTSFPGFTLDNNGSGGSDNYYNLSQIIANWADYDNDTDPQVLYFPAGVYAFSEPINLPSGWTLFGDSALATVLRLETISAENAVIQLQPIDGVQSDTSISDMMLSNQNTDGYGIRAETLSGYPISIENLQVHLVELATKNVGIYLPSNEAVVTDSTFMDVTAGMYYDGVNAQPLNNSLISLNGHGNLLERISGTGNTDQYQIIVNSDSDSEPTWILGGDTEGNGLFYDLSGPDINFFGHYINDQAHSGDIVLNDVAHFEADNLGQGGGTDIDSPDGDIHVDFVDQQAPDLSQIFDLVDDSSIVHIGLMKYANSSDVYGVPDSVLTNNRYDIASSYTTVGSTDAVEDVVVQNASASSVTVASSEDDPNQLAVSDSNISAINVVSSEDYPYIIGAAQGANLTLDFTNGIPAASGGSDYSWYFKGATGSRFNPVNNTVTIIPPAAAPETPLQIVSGAPTTASQLGISNAGLTIQVPYASSALTLTPDAAIPTATDFIFGTEVSPAFVVAQNFTPLIGGWPSLTFNGLTDVANSFFLGEGYMSVTAGGYGANFEFSTEPLEYIALNGGNENDSLYISSDVPADMIGFDGEGGDDSITESGWEATAYRYVGGYITGNGVYCFPTNVENVTFDAATSTDSLYIGPGSAGTISFNGIAGGTNEIYLEDYSEDTFAASVNSPTASDGQVVVAGQAINFSNTPIIDIGEDGSDNSLYLTGTSGNDSIANYATPSGGEAVLLDQVNFYYNDTAGEISQITIDTGGGNNNFTTGYGSYGAANTAVSIIVPDGSSNSLELDDATGMGLISLSGLSVDNAAYVDIQSGETLQVTSLYLGEAGSYATLDLGDDTLFIESHGSGIDSDVFNWLQSAYDNGNWDGTGIRSSDASYDAGTAVGYCDNGSAVEIKETWIGDTNLDGVVDSSDLNRMSTQLTGWQNGDFNYDGKVNADDYALFQYGYTEYQASQGN